jgi:hypothetical protein
VVWHGDYLRGLCRAMLWEGVEGVEGRQVPEGNALLHSMLEEGNALLHSMLEHRMPHFRAEIRKALCIAPHTLAAASGQCLRAGLCALASGVEHDALWQERFLR